MDPLVIIGNGPASVALCSALAEQAIPARRRVVVLGEEPLPAYHRHDLARHLLGAPFEPIRPTPWYEGQGIDLRLDTAAVGIDRQRRVVHTASGSTVPYGDVVLATGAQPWLPPITGRDLPAVVAVRDAEDINRLAMIAASARRIIVLGGGMHGVEIAVAMRQADCAVDLVEVASGILLRQLDLVGAAVAARRLNARGIDVHCGRLVVRIIRRSGGIAVVFADATMLCADAVVLATGLRPRDEIAAVAGLRRGLRGGLLVDAQGRTDDPQIFAIGACVTDSGASQQPAVAVAAALTQRMPPAQTTVPIHRLHLDDPLVQSAGEPHGVERDVVLANVGDDGKGEWHRRLVLRRDRLVGAAGVGSWPEFDAIAAAIGARRRVWHWQVERFRRTGALGFAPPIHPIVTPG